MEIHLDYLFVVLAFVIIKRKKYDFNISFYIKFIKVNFPPLVLNSGVPGTPYVLDETDEVKIKGDIEKFK